VAVGGGLSDHGLRGALRQPQLLSLLIG